jgi:hypothetical protein
MLGSYGFLGEVSMNELAPTEDELLVEWYLNHYDCDRCGTEWANCWSCMCDDKCPSCGVSVSPSNSEDLSRQLNHADFEGALAVLRQVAPRRTIPATPSEARIYAQAMLEGGMTRVLSARLWTA